MDNTASLQDDQLIKLQQILATTTLPGELKEKTEGMLKRCLLSIRFGGHIGSFDALASYIDWITSLPWDTRSQDNLDIKHAKKVLDIHHYGLAEIKDRILEYLAVLKLTSGSLTIKAPVLLFLGLVGTGKTTIAISIAKALNRSFVRIPFGGMGSALDLRGQSRQHPDAQPGLLIKALKRAGYCNPVILLDELDRVSDQARADIMGVLVELLDPEQNAAFVDHYIDFPFNLSEVLFIATANNTNNISTAVLDRLEPIQMPSYNDEEKTVIGKSYVYPKSLVNAGLTPSQLAIDDNVWPIIVRPLGFDSGIRTLERNINGICSKVARMIVENKGTSFRITPENIKLFLPTW